MFLPEIIQCFIICSELKTVVTMSIQYEPKIKLINKRPPSFYVMSLGLRPSVLFWTHSMSHVEFYVQALYYLVLSSAWFWLSSPEWKSVMTPSLCVLSPCSLFSSVQFTSLGPGLSVCCFLFYFVYLVSKRMKILLKVQHLWFMHSKDDQWVGLE